MKLNIGIIDVGYWGKKILQEYVKLANGDEGVNVESIYDANKENLQHCRQCCFAMISQGPSSGSQRSSIRHGMLWPW